MELEIIDDPIAFDLVGLSATVGGRSYGEVGCRVMDAMWGIVKLAELENTGINHWAYFADDGMFVGVELREPGEATIPESLERCECQLLRYARHLHIGPYHQLPQKWQSLRSELATRGERISAPSLEVYGHACEGEDDSRAETMILIGLGTKCPSTQ